jgi:hypothetical protein
VNLPANTSVVVATLNLPAGDYVIMAKTSVVQTDTSGGTQPPDFTRCTLNGDPATVPTPGDDYASTDLGRGNAWEVGRATLHTPLTIEFATPTSIQLRCRRTNTGSANLAVARETKLIAIKVDAITRMAVTG